MARVTLCRSNKCRKEIVFLINTETGHSLPVDYSSLTMDEVKGLQNGINVLYNKQHHVSHYRTCPDANKFRKLGSPARRKFGSNGNKP